MFLHKLFKNKNYHTTRLLKKFFFGFSKTLLWGPSKISAPGPAKPLAGAIIKG